MNPKPKPATEDTQQFSAADVKAEGLKSYRSPRNQQQQPPALQPSSPNVAVQITALLVVFLFVVALLVAGVIIALDIIH